MPEGRLHAPNAFAERDCLYLLFLDVLELLLHGDVGVVQDGEEDVDDDEEDEELEQPKVGQCDLRNTQRVGSTRPQKNGVEDR